jgi:iron only hydrogenase large subunit-like protein
MNCISVKSLNCKNCYKCLKHCMVKSIKYRNDQVEVIDEKCILCGECVNICPQEAKKVISDIDKVKELIKDKNVKKIVSIAPSYISVYSDKNKLVSGLLKLGFDGVEETAIGAAYVTEEYKKLINKMEMDNILTSCCPTINLMISKYYPELIDNLAPVLSPVLVHGKLIKEKYGSNTSVIFIGPCLSKIYEINQDLDNRNVDYAITFQDLDKWFIDENIDLDTLTPNEFNLESPYSRVYPISKGILYDLKNHFQDKDSEDKINKYDLMSVSGLENVESILKEISNGNIKNVFIEVNACSNGCVNGPLMPKNRTSILGDTIKIKRYADEIKNSVNNFDRDDLSKKFFNEKVESFIPDEDKIKDILMQIGKVNKDDELNCGSCGYDSCRDKAVAVYQGKAELHMCLPYMSEMAQSLSNVTLNVTPNYIIAVNEDMKIKEFNLAAQKLFKISRNDALNKYLFDFIDPSDFEKVFETQEDIRKKKVRYEDLGITIMQTIVYVKEQKIAMGILKNITEEEENIEKMYNLKLDTVNMAQNVINKQMRVAQEIASLLGETTAETKVTLNKLKKLIINEGNNINE